MKTRVLTLLVLSLFFFISHVPSAVALSCAELKDPQETLKVYGGAVFGEVLQVKEDMKQRGFTGTIEYVRNVLVEVEQSWNMEVDSQIIVSTDYTWGYDYKEGKSYLIYISNLEGEWVSGPCSPTVEMNNISEATQLFGSGLNPKNEVNIEYKMWFMFSKDIDLIVVASLALVLVFLIYRIARMNKRKKP